MKRVLMVAYHFPPYVGSSGLLRSLKYCRYLPEHGWKPTVLTANPRVYGRVDAGQLAEIPSDVEVVRALAFDTARHLSLRRRYLRYTALPDRWVTWCLGAVPAGIFTIYKKKIDAILTTFPIGTAVLIGYLLHRFTGVPWIADFRDPMTEDDYPRDPQTRRVLRWLERKAVQHASRLIFTAESTMKMYLKRYSQLAPEKCLLIQNGFDEEDFRELLPVERRQNGHVRIQHSGLIYPEERNPLPFFGALSRLKKERLIDHSSLTVDLRAPGNEESYRRAIADWDIQDIVRILPPISYKEALYDSNASDALLLLQGPTCNHQIPAKAYEYLRLQKPILALTSKQGDTAALLDKCGGATIVDLDDENAIYCALPGFLKSIREGVYELPKMGVVATFSRQYQARELAECLSRLIDAGACDTSYASSSS